jgi:hypothetical protein
MIRMSQSTKARQRVDSGHRNRRESRRQPHHESSFSFFSFISFKEAHWIHAYIHTYVLTYIQTYVCDANNSILKNFKQLFFSQTHTMTMHNTQVLTTTLQFHMPKILHPDGIRNRDLLYLRRTRWPLCQVAARCATNNSTAMLKSLNISHLNDIRNQVCQIFLGTAYQYWEIYTERPLNIPKGQKAQLQ